MQTSHKQEFYPGDNTVMFPPTGLSNLARQSRVSNNGGFGDLLDYRRSSVPSNVFKAAREGRTAAVEQISNILCIPTSASETGPRIVLKVLGDGGFLPLKACPPVKPGLHWPPCQDAQTLTLTYVAPFSEARPRVLRSLLLSIVRASTAGKRYRAVRRAHLDVF